MQKKKILFVDDSASIRALVKMILENAGYAVTLGTDGQDALEQLNGIPYDLIITDLHMPRMNGLELIKELRKKNEYRFVPILFLTTETKTEIKQEAKAAGATGWITKPFNDEKLLQIIKKVIR
ncbi:response regulator [Candidatus Sulfidibacterium hydrothermale]|uniref:response regulator n=1 Tax=Candidatus Sulfidibacterium hydrothermale TaxID=2875962 RepID=UPI001F0B1AD2|nr:response regulator [Candidatus Sulfidibacterium hydrothermale]UBM61863.1 response regulator [Candidatus Sulfidibacterium hydrothermale]